MDSAGPVTRSRARAVPSTPADGVPATTPATRRSTRLARSTKDTAAAPEMRGTELFKEAEATEVASTDAVQLKDAVQAAVQLKDSAWQDSETVFSISGSLTPWTTKRTASPVGNNTPAAASPASATTPQPEPQAAPYADGVVDFLLSPEATQQDSPFENDLASSVQNHLDLVEDDNNNHMQNMPVTPSPVSATAADFSFDLTIPEDVMDVVNFDTSTPTLLTPPRETANSSNDDTVAAPAPSPLADSEPAHATYVVSSDPINLSCTPAFTRTTAADFIDAATPIDAASNDHHTGHVYHAPSDDDATAMDDAWSEDGTFPSSSGDAEEDLMDDDYSQDGSAAASPAAAATPAPSSAEAPAALTSGFTPVVFSTPVASPISADEANAAFAELADDDLDLGEVEDMPADSPCNLEGALALAGSVATPVQAALSVASTPEASTSNSAAKARTPAASRTPAGASSRSAKTPATAPAGSRAAKAGLVKTPATARAAKPAAVTTPSASVRMLDVLADISGSASNRQATTPNLPAYMKPTQASLIKASSAAKVQKSPAPLKAQAENASENAGPKAKLKSMVVAADSYDGRSIRQLKKEIKVAAANKAMKEAAQVQVCGVNEIRRTPANEQDWEVEESMDTMLVADESDGEEVEGTLDEQEYEADQLTAKMGQLAFMPLRGLPAAQGEHVRFGDNLTPIASPSNGKVMLRGVPVADGRHIRFDE